MDKNFWTKEKITELLKLFNDGLLSSKIAEQLECDKKSVINKINRLGLKFGNGRINLDHYEIIKCLNCQKEVRALKTDNRKFCSKSCSSSVNNSGTKRNGIKKNFCEIDYCKNCKKVFRVTTSGRRHNKLKQFCSSKCTGEIRTKQIIELIENGNINQSSKQYKKYLILKHGEKCMKCGWNEKNIFSGNIPIELEHKDGNSENNSLNNLELLCPNCHSLTKTYKSLNIGNGRHNRRERYKNGQSF